MSKKENTYLYFQRFIKDKDKAVSIFIENTLAKTQSMFIYEGLPDTLPQYILERMLQQNGTAFITKVNGELYAFLGGEGGVPDVYNRPTQFIVANPFLQLNKTFTIDEDGVLIKNDTHGNSLLNIIGGYAVLHVDSIISLNVASVLSRIPMLISASDDKTKESAEEFMNKITDGEFSIIGENAFFKGVSTHPTQTNTTNQLSQLIELIQYYKGSMFNELGLNANYNMKRERLNTSEVSMNIDVLLPYVDNMLVERKNAIRKVNEMFGTEITVELASTWEITHNEIEHSIENEPVEAEEPLEAEDEPVEEVIVVKEGSDETEEPVEPVETEDEPVEEDEVAKQGSDVTEEPVEPVETEDEPVEEDEVVEEVETGEEDEPVEKKKKDERR